MRVLSGNSLEPSGKCVFSLVGVSLGTPGIWEHALICWGLQGSFQAGSMVGRANGRQGRCF